MAVLNAVITTKIKVSNLKEIKIEGDSLKDDSAISVSCPNWRTVDIFSTHHFFVGITFFEQ